MGTFDSSRCVNRDGTRRATTDIDIVDKYGTIRGAAQFDAFNVVDMYGNLGQLVPTGPWEMQLGTIETVGAHQGTIANSYINASNLTNFTSTNCVGYMAGNIGGSGTFNIKNGPQTIGGVSYTGNGITIFSGNNTCTGILNMEANTNIQLGLDCANAVTKWAGNLTIGAGATCTQYNGWGVNTYLCQALTNTGTYNVTGCGTCGIGIAGLATTVANNGVINIKGTAWRNQSTWSGTGTVNVLDTGTFVLTTNAIGPTTTANINGCGHCDATGMTLGAINATGAGVTIAMKINVETAACIKGAGASTTFSGVLSGSAPLYVGNTAATGVGNVFHFSNALNTYNGIMTLDRVVMNGNSGNSLQYAKVVFSGGSYMNSSATQTLGAIASTDPTASWRIADGLNCYIQAKGITPYAAKLVSSGGLGTSNVWMEGPSTNQLTITSTGNSCNFFARGGSKLILQGATFVAAGGQVRVSGGSTVSAGTSTTAQCTYLYIDATSALDVRSTGTGAGLIKATSGFSMGAGWKINALDAMAPGTYPIIQKPNTAVLTPAPTLGINNTGHAVTFSQVGNFVNMIVS